MAGASSPSWMVGRVCEGCGGDFEATKYDVAKGWGRFCSRACKSAVLNVGGPQSPRWKTGRTRTPAGYIWQATGTSGGQLEHIVIAERALGHALPAGAQVHHVNGVKSDNVNRNLVICQDVQYHKFLHKLARIRSFGGRPFLDRRCGLCKQIKPIEAFSGSEYRCKPCNAARVVAAAESRSAA